MATTGTPAGWVPARTVTGTYTVSTPGAVVEDVRVLGDLVVAAPGVTLRRVEVVGGVIDNYRGSRCFGGLVVKDSTVRRSGTTTDGDLPALGAGGYSADNVLIDGASEGFRVGGRSGACGSVSIANSYARVVAPDVCGDWHGDGIQGYDGDALTVRRSVVVLVERSGCSGTAAFFYPGGQGNTSVDVAGLVVAGGGYPFRMTTPGSVQGLKIVEGWGYGPTEVRCSQVTAWGAEVVRLDSAGQPVAVRAQACMNG